jgi:hypothetical protein
VQELKGGIARSEEESVLLGGPTGSHLPISSIVPRDKSGKRNFKCSN